MNQIPYLELNGLNSTLYVDGKPFYARAGELHNSSASSLKYMEERVWPALRPLHLNTVILPIYWECFEPEEGVFDYELVDGLIAQARQENVRLAVIWFGLWKNSASTYVPAWVKEDMKRFWYVNTEDGGIPSFHDTPHFIVSPLCQEAIDADVKAFSELMRYIKKVDDKHTVIMIQVENEVGVLGSDRDYSPFANNAFEQSIPEELKTAFNVEGNWMEAFGKERAAESFMAYYYARAIQQLIEAGKKEYPLPMFVNCWLDQEPWIPGSYPSGGPIVKNQAIWQVAAPSVDLYAPDIYLKDYKGTLANFGTESNPLFIPETMLDVAKYLYALGKYNAMCFSTFGLEDAFDTQREDVDAATLALLQLDPETFAMQQSVGEQLGRAYAYAEGMDDIIRSHFKEGKVNAWMDSFDNAERKDTVSLSNVNINVLYNGKEKLTGGGFVVELNDYEFVVCAINCQIDFVAKDGSTMNIITKEEGSYVDGKWERGRILNGDERYRNVFNDKVSLIRFKFIKY